MTYARGRSFHGNELSVVLSCRSLDVNQRSDPHDVMFGTIRHTLDRNNVNIIARTQKYKYKNTCTCDFLKHTTILCES